MTLETAIEEWHRVFEAGDQVAVMEAMGAIEEAVADLGEQNLTPEQQRELERLAVDTIDILARPGSPRCL